jgi:hypothetical protein
MQVEAVEAVLLLEALRVLGVEALVQQQALVRLVQPTGEEEAVVVIQQQAVQEVLVL